MAQASLPKLRLSEEMKQQLDAMKPPSGARKDTALKVMTFESELDSAVPDPVVMWEKSTCC